MNHVKGVNLFNHVYSLNQRSLLLLLYFSFIIFNQPYVHTICLCYHDHGSVAVCGVVMLSGAVQCLRPVDSLLIL